MRHLVERYPFVRLVGLRDVAGAAQNRGNPRVVKQRRFGAEGYLVECRPMVAAAAKRSDLAVGAGIEAGEGGQLFERYSGVMFVSDVTVSRSEYFANKATKA